MKIKSDNSIDDMKGFIKNLQEESPRAAVIIAGAYLDEQLRQLILGSFVNKSKGEELVGSESKIDRPLSSFSSRINLAYCLGLIDKRTYDDLNIIRKIRNKFAHKLHHYSWNEPEIVNWCKTLKHSQMITKINPSIRRTHGDLFIIGVVQVASWLGLELVNKKL
ncbi:MAG: MltR family transcriptional regulator [bacterium]